MALVTIIPTHHKATKIVLPTKAGITGAAMTILIVTINRVSVQCDRTIQVSAAIHMGIIIAALQIAMASVS